MVKKNKRRKNLLSKIALSIAAIVSVLIFTEIMLRIFYPQNLNITRLDEEKVFELKPNIESVLRRQEFLTHIKINSDGMRDREYGIDKPKDNVRIAVIGDSFVFGFGVELNQSAVKRLESKLNSAYERRYEVMNFGVSAYGTEQEYLLIKDRVVKYEPDIILVGFFLNDIKENVKYNLFDIKNSVLIRNQNYKITPLMRLRNYISWNSHLYSLFYFSVADNENLRKFMIKVGLVNPQQEDPSTDFDALVYSNAKNVEFDYAMNKTVLLFDAIKELFKKNNAELVVFLVPSKEQVDDEKMEEYAKYKNIGAQNLNETKIQQIMKNALQKKGIYIIDILEKFRKSNVNNTFYYSIDGHWNEKGHELAAQILFERLRDNKILKK